MAVTVTTLAGYISGDTITDQAGRRLAQILTDKQAKGYGNMARRHIRAASPLGLVFSGSCTAGADYVTLKQVKA